MTFCCSVSGAVEIARQPGSYPRDERTQSACRGAHDANVDLDDTPIGCGWAIPRGIIGIAEEGDGVDAED